MSEGIDPRTSALIVKFAQVRAAEYTKVAIGNMDIQDAKDKLTSKTSILSSIRGEHLGEEVSSYLIANATSLVEANSRTSEFRLNAPIEVLVEGSAKNAKVAENLRGRANDQARRQGQPELASDYQAPEEVKQEVIAKTGAIESDWKTADIDKLNAIYPFLLSFQITYSDKQVTEVTIGVKAVPHIIPSADIVLGIGAALQRDSFALQFLRLTSGEISFFKDFLLRVNVAKMRNMSSTSVGIKHLETLRRQAEWNERRANRFMSLFGSSKGMVPPTATIVITTEEAEIIRSTYGVDFSKPAVVRELLRSHNLLGFMIVDQSIGLIKVFEDGDNDFDRVTFNEIKTQSKDGELKDVFSVLARR